jgi:ABC-type transport system involved in cytochrome bd biosynthesis fused ATPase/permease subunit
VGSKFQFRGTQKLRIALSALTMLVISLVGLILDSAIQGYVFRTWIYLSLFCLTFMVRYIVEKVRERKDELASRAQWQYLENRLPVAAGIFNQQQYPDHHITSSSAADIFANVAKLYLAITPMAVELTVFPIWLSVLFEPAQGLIMFLTVALSLYFTALGFFRAVKFQRAAKRDLLNFHDGRQAHHFYANDWRHSILDNLGMATLMTGFIISASLAVVTVQALQAKLDSLMVLFLIWEYLGRNTKYISDYCKKFADDLTAAERLMNWMRDSRPVVNRHGARPLRLIDGTITFDHVSLRGFGNKHILHDLCLEFPGGSIVAVVGKSGAGKSALLKMLARTIDATDGVIRIDGQDIRDVRLEGYCERVKLMPQEPIAIGETVLSTIKSSTSLVAPSEVEFACKLAHIYDEILDFPNGFFTRLGEQNFQVSRGQQQRLGIAHIYLQHPDIFLMDNPTASLSDDMEAKVWGALTREFGKRTVVVVT